MLELKVNKGDIEIKAVGDAMQLMTELLIAADAFYEKVAQKSMPREEFAAVLGLALFHNPGQEVKENAGS